MQPFKTGARASEILGSLHEQDHQQNRQEAKAGKELHSGSAQRAITGSNPGVCRSFRIQGSPENIFMSRWLRIHPALQPWVWNPPIPARSCR